MKSYTSIKRALLKDQKVHDAYAKLGPEFIVIERLIEKRLQRGLTQSALGAKLKITVQ